jgi:hypothetical protein
MRKIIFIVFTSFIHFLQAQNVQELGSFDKIKTFDKLQVELIKSNENKVVIEGLNEDKVVVLVKNEELKIRMPLTKLLAGRPSTFIKVYYKKLNYIDASEGSSITSEDTIIQKSLDINAREGASISLNLKVDNLVARAVSGATFSLTGFAKSNILNVKAGGSIEAEDLKTEKTTVSVTAGGTVKLNASVFVDAKVNAGGTILIYGNPNDIKKETNLGGTIVEKN